MFALGQDRHEVGTDEENPIPNRDLSHLFREEPQRVVCRGQWISDMGMGQN